MIGRWGLDVCKLCHPLSVREGIQGVILAGLLAGTAKDAFEEAFRGCRIALD